MPSPQTPQNTTEHLRALAVATGSTADLAGSLDSLLALAHRAVPSCIALTLLLNSQSVRLTVTATSITADGPPIRASLAVRMPSRVETGYNEPNARLVLYATEPRVFDSVARDLITLLDLHVQHAETDAHLTAPDADADAYELGARLGDRRAVDLALGILLERGLLPLEGRAELNRLGVIHGTNHVHAARRLVSQAQTEPWIEPTDR